MLKEFLFLIATAGQAQPYTDESYSDMPTQADYEAAANFNVSRETFRKEHKIKAATVDVESIRVQVANALEVPGSLPSAYLLDKTLEATIQRGNAALRRFGYMEEAEKIEVEYAMAYKGYFVRQHTNGGVPVEIGQHPPLNLWIELVHVVIHIKLGDFWCQYFHAHDMFVINFAVPVVFKPQDFDLPDYLDHFAGHPLSTFKWDHHGLAGVITYWAVTIGCGAATSGIGLLTFVCGPISGFSESFMDRKLAPPIAKSIWKHAQTIKGQP